MFRRRSISHEIAPNEIFLDSTNLPADEIGSFEGRVERPVSRRAIFGVALVFAAVVLMYGGRALDLGVVHGATYAEISRDNTIESWPLFAVRGIVYDAKGRQLAWNE